MGDGSDRGAPPELSRRADRRIASPTGRTSAARRRPLHIDSSYGYPTEGRGMFRLFCNVDPAGRPRVWQVGEPFESFARRFIPGGPAARAGWMDTLLSRLKIRRGRRTLYDDVIAELRLLGKRDSEYQRTAPREIVSSRAARAGSRSPTSCRTARCPGRHSLDQTFFLPATGMADPHRSSLYILERLTGGARVTVPAHIVLVAGTVKARDTVGHHDYLAGCRLAAFLLAQTPGVERHDGPRRLAGGRRDFATPGRSCSTPVAATSTRFSQSADASTAPAR